MGKRIDITEKLGFETNPVLVIKDKELEVNTDAATVLRALSLIGDGGEMNADTVGAIGELIFTDTARKNLEKMKLNFADYQTVMMAAIELVTGVDEENPGN